MRSGIPGKSTRYDLADAVSPGAKNSNSKSIVLQGLYYFILIEYILRRHILKAHLHSCVLLVVLFSRYFLDAFFSDEWRLKNLEAMDPEANHNDGLKRIFQAVRDLS